MSASLDDLPASLDSRQWISNARYRGAIDSSHKLATFTGDPLEAVFETGEAALGFTVNLDKTASGLSFEEAMFGEAQGRCVVSVAKAVASAVKAAVNAASVAKVAVNAASVATTTKPLAS